MNEEFKRQIVWAAVRYVIVLIGGALVTKGFLTQELVDQLLRDNVIAGLVGAVMVIAGLVWVWLKVRFNINFVNAGIKAPAGTPIAEVKQNALMKNETQVSA